MKYEIKVEHLKIGNRIESAAGKTARVDDFYEIGGGHYWVELSNGFSGARSGTETVTKVVR